MTTFDWKQLLSENDPIGADSPFYVSDLPFTQKMIANHSSLNLEDKGYIKTLFKDKIVVDLGSGNPKQPSLVRQLACESRAKECVGIDINYPRAELFDEYPGSRILQMTENCGENAIPITFLREDMLVALQRFEKHFPNPNYVFILIGIETTEKETFYPLAEALSRQCSSGGRVLLGLGTHGIPLGECGFMLERRIIDGQGGVFFEVFRRDKGE